ncbi:MAG: spore germination protein GerW family protein [Bryobacteraceae bacterium]
MDVPELLRAISERLATGATVKNVFGEPVTAGQRTVIPIARVSFAFGGGGGPKPDDATKTGGGGGGRVSATPFGVLEITPEGTRFIGFSERQMAAALAVGFAIGWIAGRFRER